MKLISIVVLTLVYLLPTGSVWAALTQTEVSQLYIGVFGRASEGGGNSYWQTDPGSSNMTATANVMLNTEPAKAYFGIALSSNQDFIEHIYLNTLGKSYAEDTVGIDYWVSELDGGKTKGEVIAALITAAQHPDNAGTAQETFNNKVTVSNYCADNISEYTDLATFVGFIVNVTDAASSVTSAKELVDTVVSNTILPAFTVIEVGPGRTHEDLSTIDWPNLKAGDEVRIFWRQEPYHSKIGLRALGTSSAPVRLKGMAGPGGQRPVISGQNATTPSSLSGFFDTGQWSTENIGVITILSGPDDVWGYKPGYIEIEGLKIVGGHPDYQFTGMDGNQYNFGNGAAGIHANVVENLTVRDCEFSDNANGFFVLSRGEEEKVSRNILFEKNYLHDNGVVGSDQEHSIYTQASGITFQYNRINALRAGSGGIALKDRSANTVIRYNWIVSGARTIDLVEPEDSYQVMLTETGFSDTWIYGNIIINEYSSSTPYATNMIHYGGDMGETFNYRKGTLHFFHNTVYIKMNQVDEWSVTLFDLSTNDESVEIINNIIYRNGDSLLYLARDAGRHTFEANNWINAGWEPSSPDNAWHTFAGQVTVNAVPLEGTSPGLTNSSGYDFSVPVSSEVYDKAASLPTTYASHPVDHQYVLHLTGEIRQQEGSASELGAFEK